MSEVKIPTLQDFKNAVKKSSWEDWLSLTEEQVDEYIVLDSVLDKLHSFRDICFGLAYERRYLLLL